MNSLLKKKLATAGLLAALPLVAFFEGTIYPAYLDPIGIPTICSGHTKGVKLGQVATPQECDEKTVEDLLEAEKVVNSCVAVPLNSNQKSAFVSFAFNVGRGKKGVKDGFCELKSGKPSTLITKLNAKDYRGACDQLLYWIKAGGIELRGLVKRRHAERQLCLLEPT
nr:lysozyme [uncultured Undibacterium sp.]